MAWIESHQSLREHPKLSDMTKRLEINKAQAIGHLHMLWWWCIDYATNGRLERFSHVQIAEAAGFVGDAKTFVDAIADSNFLDRNPLRVHDWRVFCGELIKKRLQYKLHKRRRKTFSENSLRNPENSLPTNQPNQPTKTNSNQPKREAPAHPEFASPLPTPADVTAYSRTIGFDLDGEKFCDYYAAKGWLVGNEPMRDWKAMVRNWKKTEKKNGGSREPDGSESIFKQVDRLEAARKAEGLRKVSSAGEVFAGIRNLPDAARGPKSDPGK